MLDIESINHVGIRIKDKNRSTPFYAALGFEMVDDAGFEDGHPIIMRHPSGVVLNLLGPASTSDGVNILMDVEEKYPGYTHIALTVKSLDAAKEFVTAQGIDITGSFSFKNMSAIFIRDPDRNVIELDSYGETKSGSSDGYNAHP
jgi:catechol 2,3-dioxygenase-like lactoylglutathione lyase family enzyme